MDTYDTLLSALELDPRQGLTIISANELAAAYFPPLNPDLGALIIDINSSHTTKRVLRVLRLVAGLADKLDVSVLVNGGGITGQSSAVSHGLARALLKMDENFRPDLKKAGLLTRDARIKERKKPGLKRARKAPTYTKR